MLDTIEVIMKNNFSKNYLFLVSIFFLLSCSSPSESPTAVSTASTDNTLQVLIILLLTVLIYP